MMKENIQYRSGEKHGIRQAKEYSKTDKSPHRWLAYRDFSKNLSGCENLKSAVDYGAGAGASTKFLVDEGYDVVGIDRSPSMLQEARIKYPEITFMLPRQIKRLKFDLVFSSFVLFEMSSKIEIINYLKSCSDLLKKGGIFYAITGSEHLHLPKRKWLCFDVDYPENYSVDSGDEVVLSLKGSPMKFTDFYWKTEDYVDCFDKASLDVVEINNPLGMPNEPFSWEDELFYSPFTVFTCRRFN